MSQAVIKEPVKRELPSATMIAFALMLALTLGALIWTAIELTDPSALPIRKVKVEGEFSHLDPNVLQAVVVDAVDAGFFGVNVAEIRRRLLDEPWIREATIRRVWPDALFVSVVEQTPVARWGEQALLNEVGDLFAPDVDQLPSDLVLLDGPLGSEIDVLREYRFFTQQLAEIGLAVSAVSLSPRYAWAVRTRDGKELILGRSDVHLRLARFKFGYERGLRDIWARIGRIDLRYTNGFAVAETRATDSGANAATTETLHDSRGNG